jgi:Protein of unknown function (DUF3606)
MPDNLSKKRQPDRSKINMNEDYEVRYWTKHLGVSKEELQKAVDRGAAASMLQNRIQVWRFRQRVGQSQALAR